LAVLRTSPCSIEIVRHSLPGSQTASHGMKLLLGTDGSELATKAAYSVANRPWPEGSEIKVISVRDLPVLESQATISSLSPVYPESLLQNVLENARKRTEAAVTEATTILTSAGLKVCDTPQEMPVGDPRSILLGEANTWPADLIVVGSHGRHGFDRILLGSVSESIALHAHCSVEVIHA
jgi:nucleotide-binding universal stress UspA family protein